MQAFRPVARVGVRLGRDCTDLRLRPRHDRPTARNFDCGDAHCCASRSQAQIEYVVTGRSAARSAPPDPAPARRGRRRGQQTSVGDASTTACAVDAWTTTGVPRSCASRMARSSETSSRTSAPRGRASPPARSRAPCAPLRRTSASLTAEPSRRARARAPRRLPGRGPELRRCAVEQWEGSVVAGDDPPDAEELDRNGGLARPHWEVVADRKNCDVGPVDTRDQRHVAEDVRVAGVVELEAVLQPEHDAARLARVRAVVRAGGGCRW